MCLSFSFGPNCPALGLNRIAHCNVLQFPAVLLRGNARRGALRCRVCNHACGLQGTLLRTAVALGWEACFLLPGCCDPFNDKALKAGRGAAFKLPIAEGDWNELRKVLQKHSMQCYGASPYGEEDAWGSGTQQQRQSESEKSYESDGVPQERDNESDAVCLVLGSEGQGLSETAMKHSQPVAIPMTGPMESLNVSQAGAILLFALGGKSSDLYKQLRKLQ